MQWDAVKRRGLQKVLQKVGFAGKTSDEAHDLQQNNFQQLGTFLQSLKNGVQQTLQTLEKLGSTNKNTASQMHSFLHAELSYGESDIQSTGEIISFLNAYSGTDDISLINSRVDQLQELVGRYWQASNDIGIKMFRTLTQNLESAIIFPVSKDEDMNGATKKLLDEREKLVLDYDSYKRGLQHASTPQEREKQEAKVKVAKERLDSFSKKVSDHLAERNLIRCRLIIHSILTIIDELYNYHTHSSDLLQHLGAIIPLLSVYQLHEDDLMNVSSLGSPPPAPPTHNSPPQNVPQSQSKPSANNSTSTSASSTSAPNGNVKDRDTQRPPEKSPPLTHTGSNGNIPSNGQATHPNGPAAQHAQHPVPNHPAPPAPAQTPASNPKPLFPDMDFMDKDDVPSTTQSTNPNQSTSPRHEAPAPQQPHQSSLLGDDLFDFSTPTPAPTQKTTPQPTRPSTDPFDMFGTSPINDFGGVPLQPTTPSANATRRPDMPANPTVGPKPANGGIPNNGNYNSNGGGRGNPLDDMMKGMFPPTNNSPPPGRGGSPNVGHPGMGTPNVNMGRGGMGSTGMPNPGGIPNMSMPNMAPGMPNAGGMGATGMPNMGRGMGPTGMQNMGMPNMGPGIPNMGMPNMNPGMGPGGMPNMGRGMGSTGMQNMGMPNMNPGMPNMNPGMGMFGMPASPPPPEDLSPDDVQRRMVEPEITAKIRMWSEKGGKKVPLRTLLSTLHEVLWEGSGWEKISSGDVVSPAQVKKVHRKACIIVHPDKVNSGTVEQKVLAQRIFESLREAFEVFKAEHPDL
eukprot:TRINITY_DN3788_c1_g1_i1.p1 TRINITY_DN3788_c1_g1~~TRINITY_DN3788_c1_g1_i1.p1  ORF type:complete len:792 (-),score=168.54 TRINITY_DN3788_c1_g1_i1:66-2441(-)